jgi:predicted TIM-barrel fold metal-dependent hydrolase
MLEFEHGFGVVDVRCQLDPDAEAVEARGRDVTPERLERELTQAGVVRAVVSPGPTPADKGYLRVNNAVARLSVDRPFLAFARLCGPRDPRDHPAARLRNLTASRESHHASPDDVEQYAYDDRFHGFALDPARDGLPDAETLDRLASVGLPVFVHAGTAFPPSAVAETLLRRGLTAIVGSLGGFPLDRDLMATTLDMLDEYEDCYVDTSYVRYRDPLERALLEHPDRVLFGSGAPETHPSVGVTEILTLDIPEDAMRRAFHKNAARLLDAVA